VPRNPVNQLRNVIQDAVRSPADKLVNIFYNPLSGFSGDLLHNFGNNPANQFTADDLLAVSTFGIQFSPITIQRLVASSEADYLLELLPRPSVPLWKGALPLPGTPYGEIWELLLSLDGIGITSASKLLARKRPALTPMLDSVVVKHLRLAKNGYNLTKAELVPALESLAAAIADDELRANIDLLQPTPAHHNATPIPTLRLLDTAIWMQQSGSRLAKNARAKVGLIRHSLAHS